MNLENLSDNFYFLYVLIVSFIGFILYLIFRQYITYSENKRIASVDKIKTFNAVNTPHPDNKSLKKIKERASEQITGRFSIIRRMSIMSLFLLWSIILVIPFIGKIPAAIISIIATAIAIIVGMAAKPYVENVISGVVISFSKLFRIGDTVMVDEHYGTVEDITVTHTMIKIWDWRRLIIPNSTMLQKKFINYSITDTFQWTYIEFWISYDSDLKLVEQIATDIAKNSECILSSDDPDFWIMEMSKEGIKCWLTAWANTPSDAWLMRIELRSKLVLKLQEMGVKTHFYNLNTDGPFNFKNSKDI